MKELSGSNTKIFLSQEERESEKQKKVWNEFLNAFNKYFSVNSVPLDEQHSIYNSADICVFVAKCKAKLK